MRDYSKLLPGDSRAEELIGKELRAAGQLWREKFVPELKASVGKWTYRGFDWHAFSYEFCPALSGGEALAEYGRLRDSEYLVFFGPTLDAGYRVRGELPIFPPGTEDVYVCSMKYGWTMIFTHESDLGPYFRSAS